MSDDERNESNHEFNFFLDRKIQNRLLDQDIEIGNENDDPKVLYKSSNSLAGWIPKTGVVLRKNEKEKESKKSKDDPPFWREPFPKPKEIDYEFRHYLDPRKYMEQYRIYHTCQIPVRGPSGKLYKQYLAQYNRDYNPHNREAAESLSALSKIPTYELKDGEYYRSKLKSKNPDSSGSDKSRGDNADQLQGASQTHQPGAHGNSFIGRALKQSAARRGYSERSANMQVLLNPNRDHVLPAGHMHTLDVLTSTGGSGDRQHLRSSSMSPCTSDCGFENTVPKSRNKKRSKSKKPSKFIQEYSYQDFSKPSDHDLSEIDKQDISFTSADLAAYRNALAKISVKVTPLSVQNSAESVKSKALTRSKSDLNLSVTSPPQIEQGSNSAGTTHPKKATPLDNKYKYKLESVDDSAVESSGVDVGVIVRSISQELLNRSLGETQASIFAQYKKAHFDKLNKTSYGIPIPEGEGNLGRDLKNEVQNMKNQKTEKKNEHPVDAVKNSQLSPRSKGEKMSQKPKDSKVSLTLSHSPRDEPPSHSLEADRNLFDVKHMLEPLHGDQQWSTLACPPTHLVSDQDVPAPGRQNQKSLLLLAQARKDPSTKEKRDKLSQGIHHAKNNLGLSSLSAPERRHILTRQRSDLRREATELEFQLLGSSHPIPSHAKPGKASNQKQSSRTQHVSLPPNIDSKQLTELLSTAHWVDTDGMEYTSSSKRVAPLGLGPWLERHQNVHFLAKTRSKSNTRSKDKKGGTSTTNGKNTKWDNPRPRNKSPLKMSLPPPEQITARHIILKPTDHDPGLQVQHYQTENDCDSVVSHSNLSTMCLSADALRHQQSSNVTHPAPSQSHPTNHLSLTHARSPSHNVTHKVLLPDCLLEMEEVVPNVKMWHPPKTAPDPPERNTRSLNQPLQIRRDNSAPSSVKSSVTLDSSVMNESERASTAPHKLTIKRNSSFGSDTTSKLETAVQKSLPQNFISLKPVSENGHRNARGGTQFDQGPPVPLFKYLSSSCTSYPKRNRKREKVNFNMKDSTFRKIADFVLVEHGSSSTQGMPRKTQSRSGMSMKQLGPHIVDGKLKPEDYEAMRKLYMQQRKHQLEFLRSQYGYRKSAEPTPTSRESPRNPEEKQELLKHSKSMDDIHATLNEQNASKDSNIFLRKKKGQNGVEVVARLRLVTNGTVNQPKLFNEAVNMDSAGGYGNYVKVRKTWSQNTSEDDRLNRYIEEKKTKEKYTNYYNPFENGYNSLSKSESKNTKPPECRGGGWKLIPPIKSLDSKFENRIPLSAMQDNKESRQEQALWQNYSGKR